RSNCSAGQQRRDNHHHLARLHSVFPGTIAPPGPARTDPNTRSHSRKTRAVEVCLSQNLRPCCLQSSARTEPGVEELHSTGDCSSRFWCGGNVTLEDMWHALVDVQDGIVAAAADSLVLPHRMTEKDLPRSDLNESR